MKGIDLNYMSFKNHLRLIDLPNVAFLKQILSHINASTITPNVLGEHLDAL